jgi:hypothetical protein
MSVYELAQRNVAVPAGHRPGIDEAISKLEVLRARGPTADAFTFRKAFPAPDAASERP